MPKQVTLRSAHKKFLCAEPNGKVVANRDKAAEWEKWQIVKISKGTWALKSHHGKFLCAEPNGTLIANRDQAKEWETWTVKKNKEKKNPDTEEPSWEVPLC